VAKWSRGAEAETSSEAERERRPFRCVEPGAGPSVGAGRARGMGVRVATYVGGPCRTVVRVRAVGGWPRRSSDDPHSAEREGDPVRGQRAVVCRPDGFGTRHRRPLRVSGCDDSVETVGALRLVSRHRRWRDGRRPTACAPTVAAAILTFMRVWAGFRVATSVVGPEGGGRELRARRREPTAGVRGMEGNAGCDVWRVGAPRCGPGQCGAGAFRHRGEHRRPEECSRLWQAARFGN
jgi:hypothetical protein